MTPDEAVEAINKIIADSRGDQELSHYAADVLLCDILSELGYTKLIEIYNNMDKWYF